MLKVPKAVIDQIEANKSDVSDKCYSKCNCVVIMGYFTIHTFSFVIQQPLFNVQPS